MVLLQSVGYDVVVLFLSVCPHLSICLSTALVICVEMTNNISCFTILYNLVIVFSFQPPQ